MASMDIIDVVTASVYSEKTRMKKLMMMLLKMIIIIISTSRKKRVFPRAPKIDFCYETKAKKVKVDFKFDALYR